MKLDVKKLDHYRAKTGEFRVFTVPPSNYLLFDGFGDPNTAREYKVAIESLYPLAYMTKFLSKATGQDYVVGPLEGLWWADDYEAFTSRRNKDEWKWTMMIALPEWINEDTVDQAREQLLAKKDIPPALDRVRFEGLDEGQSIQTLHIGPYDDEGQVVEAMHAHIADLGLPPTGYHHEIYFSDPRRTAPEKLKTILRQPVSPA